MNSINPREQVNTLTIPTSFLSEKKELKHIFYIHSQICFIISKHIIELNKINIKDVIFISNRGFSFQKNNSFKTIAAEQITNGPVVLQWNILKSAIECIRFDKKINNITKNKSYYTYIPQTTIGFVELLITHKNCAGFYYVEEGHSSYESLSNINSMHYNTKTIPIIIKRLGWLNRIKNNNFFEIEKCKALYCTSKIAFPGARKKIVLDEIFKKQKNIFETNTEKKFYCAFDAISVYNNDLQSAHIIAFLIAIKKYIKNNNITKIIIKYHPEQLINNEYTLFEKIINKELNGIIEIDSFPPNCSLELQLMEENNADILILSSSIGMYAQRMGHTVYTFFNIFKELVPDYLQNSEYFKSIENISKKFNII